jgi:PD-(D/E)XK nuclease superfamily protein
MPLARASELDRLLVCPGSAVLPRVRDEEGIAAAYGTCVHYWAETGRVLDGTHGRLLHRKLEATHVDREVLWPPDGEHEVAFAYNVISSAVQRYRAPDPLPPGMSARAHVGAWKEGFGDEWVVGTLDYARRLFDTYWVDDLKTGRNAYWDDYRAQQTFYCLVYSLDVFADTRDGRSSITHWRRYPIDGQPNRFGVALEARQLIAFQKELRALYDVVQKTKADGTIRHHLKPGEQCKYCLSYVACPAPKPVQSLR